MEVGDGPLVLLEHAELWLERGEHVSLVGPNGSGKTTLIETLAERRPLAAGRLSRGHNVQVGYLSQHADELGAGGSPGQSVLEAAQRATGLTPNKARALLGGFLFSGEEAEKPLEGLSGGERRRLSLAVLVHSGANVLILDEPTNHLDIESREALEDALRAFQGAVLLVSHDRALLDAVGTRTVAVEGRSLRSYAGGWPEYVRVREERRLTGARPPTALAETGMLVDSGMRAKRVSPESVGGECLPASAGSDAVVSGAGANSGPGAGAGANGHAGGAGSTNGAGPSGDGGGPAGIAEREPKAKKARPKPKGPSKNRLTDQQKAERAIEEAEAAQRALEDELADPAAWATKYEAAKSEARHTAARRAVEEAYARLEALVE